MPNSGIIIPRQRNLHHTNTTAYGIMEQHNYYSVMAISQNHKSNSSNTVEQSDANALQEKVLRLESQLADLEEELVKAIIKNIRQEELMITLRKELHELTAGVKDDLSRKKIRKNLKRIEGTLLSKSMWKELEIMVNELQGNFTVELKEQYPNLTSKDLKFCIYIRMNFSTKEMAEFMGISNRSAEDSRYRLRKKFGLKKEDSLNDFILGFKG